MKKIRTVLILPLLLLIILMNTLHVHAAETISSSVQTKSESTIVFFDDGSKLVISPVYEPEREMSIKGATTTITKSRDICCEDPNGNLEWKYTLTAVFSYDYGISSTCIDASFTQTIYSDQWIFSDGSATKSGNTAYGKGYYTKKDWFVEVNNVDIDVSLTCNSYGNVK